MKFDDHVKEIKKRKAWSYSIDVSVAIAGLRIENNLTQKQLAKKVGMNQETISRIENANYYCTIKTLEKIAKALNKDLIIKFVDL